MFILGHYEIMFGRAAKKQGEGRGRGKHLTQGTGVIRGGRGRANI